MIRFDTIRLEGLTNVNLPLYGGSLNEPYLISNVDGLGPPELDVLLAETHAPGGIFVSRHAQGREIVIRCGLNPSYSTGQTVSDLRHTLYGLLSPRAASANLSIRVTLMLRGVPQVYTEGYVKRIEIVPFSKDPEVQITISCLGPYLNSMADVSVVGINETQDLWVIQNDSLAPTGIYFKVKFIRACSTFGIQILGSESMTFYSAFTANDVLTVDTNEATRFVGLARNNVYIRHMELLSDESEWLTLNGGLHWISTSNPSDFEWVEFKYRPRYWGI